MNRTISFGKKAIPVWFLMATIVGAGSLAIAVQGIDPSQEQKFQIDQMTKPKTSSFVFTGLPVGFDKDSVLLVVSEPAVSTGVEIITEHSIRINVNQDVGEEATIDFPIVNHSEDPQIVLFQCMAPDQVILDVADDSTGLDATPRLVSMNTWLLNVKPGDAAVGNISLDINTEHDGAYSVMCQLKAIG